MTIREIIDLIETQAPAGKPGQTLDTVKCGDPSRPATGIVVTFMATCRLLEQAVGLGANVIITHEPTFYNHMDETAWLNGDRTYTAKKDFIDKHGLVIWRYHDGPHRQKPDAILAGMMNRLGWKFDPRSDRQTVFSIQPQTAKSIAQHCKEKLGIQTLRIAGDPDTVCARVGFLVGAWGGQAQIQLYEKSNVDVVLCGESPEWETCEYVRDSTRLGREKALIVLGHANSEEAGMEWIASWLRTLIPAAIPITHIPAGDPFRFV